MKKALLTALGVLACLSLMGARNGAGTYVLPAGNPFVTGTVISSSTMNATLADIRDALTQSVSKDGQTQLTGDLNFGAHDAIGVGALCATSACSTSDMLTFSSTTLQLGVGTNWTAMQSRLPLTLGGAAFTGNFQLALTNTSTVSGDLTSLDLAAGAHSLEFGVCNENQASGCVLSGPISVTGTFISSFGTAPLNFGMNGGLVLQITTAKALTVLGATSGGMEDMTPDHGAFTPSATGAATPCTLATNSAAWWRVGPIVTLYLPPCVETSNSATFSYTGLPVALRPTRSQVASGALPSSNGVTGTFVTVQLTAGSGTMAFLLTGNSTVSYGTGQAKTIDSPGGTIVYTLN